MMNIAINLLPKEIKDKQREDKFIALTAIALIVVACLLCSIYTLNSWRISNAQAQVTMLNDQVVKMNKIAGDLRLYERRLQYIKQKQQVEQAAMLNKVEWSKFLEQLMVVTPGDISLTSLVGNSSGVSFTGEVLDANDTPDLGHKPVAKWLNRLSGITPEPDVWLTSSNKQEGRVTFTNTIKFKNNMTGANPSTGPGQ